MNFKPSDMVKSQPSKSGLAAKNMLASSQRQKAGKPPVKAKPVTSCSHVKDGAVWCVKCAKSFLVYARKMHTKALAESKNPKVIKAATTLVTAALTEYHITSEGIASLERQYATHAANADVNAESTRKRIEAVRKLISERNAKARTNEKKIASTKSFWNTYEERYALPYFKDGKPTVENTKYVLTKHASERMDERRISNDILKSGFTALSAMRPIGKGLWILMGSNGITFVGFFTNFAEGDKGFTIVTLYPESISITEKEMEMAASL